ncbi:hypothetical protein DL546_008247 [Coniochaeta pulveracea]|uniref:Uncharacterized protein n=1 Tax=Coniochaeta pulveracea TaxID=177199 RepID=A0A420YGM1_9PEZI|nr:hypothetical protein DL546_008247 [Coniochaeta pulveracea]
MASMTDAELDRDWKPNGRRPQSTIARSFSEELMNIFRIDNSVADLDEQVDKRKQQLSSQTTELEALEARIREMEQRLQQRKSTHYSPDSSLNQRLADAHAEHKTQTAALQTAGHQRSPVAGVFSQHQDVSDVPPPLPEKDQGRERTGKLGGNSRPGTARQSQQAVPGALPPTPTSSEPEDS